MPKPCYSNNMKKKIKFTNIFLLLLIATVIPFFTSCEKDYYVVNEIDLNTPVSFSNDVVPILTEDCAKSGCHVAGLQLPDLSADAAYDQLLGLGYVDTTNAEASILYVRIISSSNPMPPDGRLNSNEINYILAWIKQGAQNN